MRLSNFRRSLRFLRIPTKSSKSSNSSWKKKLLVDLKSPEFFFCSLELENMFQMTFEKVLLCLLMFSHRVLEGNEFSLSWLYLFIRLMPSFSSDAFYCQFEAYIHPPTSGKSLVVFKLRIVVMIAFSAWQLLIRVDCIDRRELLPFFLFSSRSAYLVNFREPKDCEETEA